MKRTLDVAGMSCRSCEGLVSDELGALDGVLSVAASAAHDTVEVELDEDRVELSQIHALITELGFQPNF